MIPYLLTRRGGPRPIASWAGAVALALGFLAGSPAASAAAPPANTVIGNQASATYLDPNGNSQLATSNLVQTTVLQVGAFTLDGRAQSSATVINTKAGAAGTTLYAPHILRNTGNGTDSFTVKIDAPASPNGLAKVEVFADANADGLPDSTTPLCSAVPAAACITPAQTVAGGGAFPFVVAYTIPSTATASTFTSPRVPTITATPGSPSLYEASNQTIAHNDNVNLTTNAAFNASKSLSVPSVAWSANGGAWPAAATSGRRSAPSCAATIAGATSGDANCAYTTFTLRFNNTGGAAGKFVMKDGLPAGFTYVPGSAVWSNAPGVALGDGTGGDSTGIDYLVSGNNLSFVVNSLPVNASQTVSFVVRVDSDAAIGTSTTTNVAVYEPLDSPTATAASPGDGGTPTNAASYNVLATFGVVLGSATGDTTASLDSSAGVPNTTAADTTTIAMATGGSTIRFTQKAFNAANASDVVNLTLANTTFPAGTTYNFLAADGATPLIDNNGDGVVDTGPIAAGASASFVLAVTLPPATTGSTGPFSAIVKGTSSGDAAKSETTRDTLTAMVGALVDLTNTAGGNGTAGSSGNGDVGTGPSPQPTTTLSTPAGTGALFGLYVKNNDTVARTYNLDASQTNNFPGNLPPGWTVKFVSAGGTCASAAITQVTVPAGNTLTAGSPTYLACVTPPASQAPVTGQRIYFRVTGNNTSGPVAVDTKTDAVTVTAPNTFSASLTPNNAGQVSPGGTVVYAHTLSNTGGQSCAGPYTITATQSPANVSAGWTTAIYIDQDGNGQIDSTDPLVTSSIPGPLPVGGTQKLLVKVFAPGGAPAGTVDTVTVQVSFPTCGTPTATDSSTVIIGQIRLLKLQALDENCDGAESPSASAPISAKPGHCVVYRMVATNEGAAPVRNLVISDTVPAYTSLTGATQPATQCTSSNVSPALDNTNYVASTTTANCGSTSNVVSPGGTATMTFSVKVDSTSPPPP